MNNRLCFLIGLLYMRFRRKVIRGRVQYGLIKENRNVSTLQQIRHLLVMGFTGYLIGRNILAMYSSVMYIRDHWNKYDEPMNQTATYHPNHNTTVDTELDESYTIIRIYTTKDLCCLIEIRWLTYIETPWENFTIPNLKRELLNYQCASNPYDTEYGYEDTGYAKIPYIIYLHRNITNDFPGTCGDIVPNSPLLVQSIPDELWDFKPPNEPFIIHGLIIGDIPEFTLDD